MAFALTAMELLQFSTNQSVFKYLEVGWDMIKEIHKSKLLTRYREPCLNSLVCLRIDESSIRKVDSYMTIFVDQRNCGILQAVEGRSVADIMPFLKKMLVWNLDSKPSPLI